MRWITAYIGKPWEARSMGPDSFDCWTLVVDIYWRQLGMRLPLYLETSRFPSQSLLERMAEVEKCGWRPVGDRINFDLMLVREPGKSFAHHCGLWLDADHGIFLHCSPSRGVVADSRKKLQRDWIITGVYRYGFDC